LIWLLLFITISLLFLSPEIQHLPKKAFSFRKHSISRFDSNINVTLRKRKQILAAAIIMCILHAAHLQRFFQKFFEKGIDK